MAYWTLAGGSAGQADRTGNGHTASAPAGFAVSSFSTGELATVFNGTSQYLEVPDHDALSVPTTGILTIEAWMRPDVLEFPTTEGSGYVHWMGKGNTGQYEFVSRMYSFTNSENRPNRISGYSFNLSGGLGAGSYFQDTVSVGQWIYYVLIVNTINTNSTYTTGYTKVYKNGVLRDQDALSGYSIIPGNGTAPFRMGTRDMASFFEGAIAKVAIYNYELSPVTIHNHYQIVVPPVLGSAAYFKYVGSANSKVAGTTLVVTVGEDIPAGSTLIARVVHEYTAGGPTMLDSRGNVWTRDQTSPNAGLTVRASLFSAPINSGFHAGDTIVLTIPASVNAKAVTIDAYSGIVFTASLDQKNNTSASSATPGGAISITTTQADALLIGFVAVNGPVEEVYTEDVLQPWSTLTRTGTTGGAATSNLTVNGAYETVGATGTYRYRPTLGVSEIWVEIIASYKAGAPVITPPPTGTAIFIANLGSTSTKTTGTTLIITVPAGDNIPVGHTLIVRTLMDFSAGAPTIADTRGNTYTRDRTAPNGGSTMRGAIFSCRITVALQSGDAITVTSASLAARTAVVDEFANVLTPIVVDAQTGATGTSTATTVSLTTTNANDLIVGFVGVEGPIDDSFTDDAIHQWTTLTRIGTTGGIGTTNKTINSAYRVVGSTGTYIYAPTLGASANWIDFQIAYKGA